MNKIFPVLWILLGSLLILIGILIYWEYSKFGVLWLIFIPEYYVITFIMLGVFCIKLGQNFLHKGTKLIRFLILIFLLIPSLTIGSILLDLIKFGDIFMWSFSIFLLPVYFLIVFSYIDLKLQSIIKTKNDIWDNFIKFKYYFLINCVVIVSMTLILTFIIPYKLFSH